MKTYTFGFEAYVSVEAEDKDEAEELAREEFYSQMDDLDFDAIFVDAQEVEE